MLLVVSMVTDLAKVTSHYCFTSHASLVGQAIQVAEVSTLKLDSSTFYY